MATFSPKTIPTEPIGSIPRPVDYAELSASLFELKAGNFCIALAGERDLRHALKIICKYRNRIYGFSWESLLRLTPIEIPKKVWAPSFEPGKNWLPVQGGDG